MNADEITLCRSCTTLVKEGSTLENIFGLDIIFSTLSISPAHQMVGAFAAAHDEVFSRESFRGI